MANKTLLTFLDASVLINAAIGPDPKRRMRALAILGDPHREFVATRFLELEVLPIPIKYKREREISFYQRFFDNVSMRLDNDALLLSAFSLACQYGLGAMDALHLAAAIAANAEFVSAEKPSKPVYAAYGSAVSIY